jgi:hypothetical protein
MHLQNSSDSNFGGLSMFPEHTNFNLYTHLNIKIMYFM